MTNNSSTAKRGDMFYIMPMPTFGHEQQMGRPAVIIGVAEAGIVQIVPLTTSPNRKAEHCHVKINSAPRPSIALCEQIKTVDVERVGAYAGTITQAEQKSLDAALAYVLGLTVPDSQRGGVQRQTKAETLETALAEACTEARIYKDLLQQVLEGRR